MPLNEHVYCVAITFKMTERVEQQICIKFCIKLEQSSAGNSSNDSGGCSYGQLVIGSFIRTMCPLTHHILCRVLWQNIKSSRWLSPSIAQIWHPTISFWLFPKLKSPLKGKRFQTVSEIQESTIGQLMVIGRTVWGPKVPTLKGTSLSYVQCFSYLVSSSTNVSILPMTWLDTF